MTKQETKIADGMLTEIETATRTTRGESINCYQQFIRACMDRRQAEMMFKRTTSKGRKS